MNSNYNDVYKNNESETEKMNNLNNVNTQENFHTKTGLPKIGLIKYNDYNLSPSIKKDGISNETFKKQKIYGCELIQRVVESLKLSQIIYAISCTLLHRFYLKVSIKEYDIKITSCAILLLVMKNEEQNIDIFTLIEIVFKCLNGNNMNIDKKKKYEIREIVVKYERVILRELGFVLYVDYPQKYVLFYLHTLGKIPNDLAQAAWSVLIDAEKIGELTLCLDSNCLSIFSIVFASEKIFKVESINNNVKNIFMIFKVNQNDYQFFKEHISCLYLKKTQMEFRNIQYFQYLHPDIFKK